MQTANVDRIQSIDLLRGIVMVVMALDHTRDYFHLDSFTSSPTNLATTTPILFFTRFITHYCAPLFVFLSGTSAFLYGQKKSKAELSKFLFTRGIWLIFVEIFINTFLWSFDIHYHYVTLQVLWAIGCSMMLLAGLIYLPLRYLFLLAALFMLSHNLLDGIKAEGSSIQAILWYIVHQSTTVKFTENFRINFFYPVLPWTSVMSLGYCLGSLYKSDFDKALRKKWLLRVGLTCIAMFFVIRGINLYGDKAPWSYQKDIVFTILSFFNLSKYPPSLDFALITIGPGLLFLAYSEQVKSKIANFFVVFGSVPFFYYLQHILFIHSFAVITRAIMEYKWESFIENGQSAASPSAEFGFSLGATYLIWIGIVLLLYPICKKYMLYKARNKDKWWLSYL